MGLQKTCGIRLRHSDRTHTTSTENGFIINRHDHWLICRKIGSNWYDLNSALEKPEFIGEFKLDAYLAQLRAEGFTIFIVEGTLPKIQSQGVGPHWLRKKELERGQVTETKDTPKFVAFGGTGNRLDGQSSVQRRAPIGENMVNLSEEEMLQQAIAMSLNRSPPKPMVRKGEGKDQLRRERLAALEK